ncbi:hypothetical protein EYC80_007285 [Monilinia laxa]|uniref:Carboxylesterase type B domain-containing protein n=1 Tax=Monilinia laxa TaxID=61186 RepID=A0A5N6JVS9_MONLA|nr:hypothetical protein EYC80_007285 [Monilinia laxa]
MFSFLIYPVLGSNEFEAPYVQTTSGTVIGHPARNKTNAIEFLGIRYAQATNGSLRYQPPVPFVSSNTYDASQYSPACPFNPAPPLPTFPNKSSTFDRIYTTATSLAFSEDCLALNIWTPFIFPKELKPVLFFIHGGRFVSGTTDNPLYQGQYLAATGDVVVVTIELVFFYFQKWVAEVKANIELFGGEPSKILMYGQCTGGLSVNYHAFAWPDDPIASASMSISGVLNDKPNSPELSKSYWDQLALLVDCNDDVEEIVVKCMQELPYQTILEAIKKLPSMPTEFLPQTQFLPTIDGEIVFSDYATRANTGRFAKLPYLVGNTNHESGYYAISAFAQNITLTQAEWDLHDLKRFTCAVSQSVSIRLKHHVPVYQYRFFDDFDNTRLYHSSGSYHLSDLHMRHGVGTDVSGIENTSEEDKLSRSMMRILISFAREPVGGLERLGWKQAEIEGNVILNALGYNNLPEALHVNPQIYNARCTSLGLETL